MEPSSPKPRPRNQSASTAAAAATAAATALLSPHAASLEEYFRRIFNRFPPPDVDLTNKASSQPRLSQDQQKRLNKIRNLTTRQLEVLNLMGLGHSQREIAAQMVISERTVKHHMYSIYVKLEIDHLPLRARHVELEKFFGLIELNRIFGLLEKVRDDPNISQEHVSNNCGISNSEELVDNSNTRALAKFGEIDRILEIILPFTNAKLKNKTSPEHDDIRHLRSIFDEVDNILKESYNNYALLSTGNAVENYSEKDKTIMALKNEVESLRIELAEYRQKMTLFTSKYYQAELPDNSKELSDALNQRGVLRFMPDSICAGMPYVVPRELAASGLTEYTYPHILKLASHNQIESFEVGGHRLLTMKGVQDILTRQSISAAGNLSPRGHRPGRRPAAPSESQPSQP